MYCRAILQLVDNIPRFVLNTLMDLFLRHPISYLNWRSPSSQLLPTSISVPTIPLPAPVFRKPQPGLPSRNLASYANPPDDDPPVCIYDGAESAAADIVKRERAHHLLCSCWRRLEMSLPAAAKQPVFHRLHFSEHESRGATQCP